MDAKTLDCISRQQAIEELETYLDEVTEYDEFSDGENSGIHMAIGVVDNLPPVEPKPMCENTISRQAAINALENINAIVRPISESDDVSLIDKAEAMTELMMLPPAQPERPKGEWLDMSDGGRIKYIWYEKYMCNKCGERGTSAWSFCPNCGADMRGDDSE